jgi:hypothetical protein
MQQPAAICIGMLDLGEFTRGSSPYAGTGTIRCAL